MGYFKVESVLQISFAALCDLKMKTVNVSETSANQLISPNSLNTSLNKSA